MSLFAQTTPSPQDYVLKQCLLYLGMKKADNGKIEAMRENEDNK